MIAVFGYGQNKINLQTQVQGILPAANGGTGSKNGGGLPPGCTSPANGQLRCSLFSTSGNTAGSVSLGQGTLPNTIAGAVQIVAPGSVSAYNLLLPGSVGTGYLFSNGGILSFQSAATANYYTSGGNTGAGPTIFTPNNTFNLLDATASIGNTKFWLGYDGNGSFTGHVSAVRTNLSFVNGSTQGAVGQTDDALSFFNAAGNYRGGIITQGSNNAFTIQAGAGVPLSLGASGGQDVFIAIGGQLTDNFGIGVTETSTAAITGPVPVKADTVNANQVVMTTTTDTGPGIVVGVCANSPGVSGSCQVIVSGIAALKLGTGTCAIGNFVIVDTTTNGRVQCANTYTAGINIGVAMAAQNTVGNTFNVLVSMR